MDPFWKFARKMLRYRLMLVMAIIFAVLSAGSLGVGLVGITPILGNILDGQKEPTLRDTAREWNRRNPPTRHIPESVINGLPESSVQRRSLRELAQDFNAQHPPAEQIAPALIAALPPEPVGRTRNLQELVIQVNNRIGNIIPQLWIDELPTGRFTTVLFIIIGLGVLTIVGGTFAFLHAYLSLTIVQRTVANIRRDSFHRVLRLPLKDVVVGGVIDKVTRIMGDAAALEGGFTSLISKAVAQVTKGIAALIAAFFIEWRMTLVSLLLGPLLYTVIRRLGKKIKRAAKSAMQSQAGLYGAALEALQGLRVVKVHTTERYEAGRFHRINKDVMQQMLRVRTARAISSPLVDALSILVLGGLSLVAANAVIKGNLQTKDFVAAFAALFAAGASLKPLTGLINDIQQSGASAARIAELQAAAPEPGHDKSLPRLHRHMTSIEFRDVTFTYPGGKSPALRGINLHINHGQRIAVVGPNGSGKTTLLALVPRLFDPDHGSIYIDGHDIRSCSVRSVRRQIGVVTQETILFRGSVRANIAYGAEDATEENIIAAAKKARAHEFISAMPQGYESPVGEQGLTLSGGQRQRISIARAVLRQPAILILDEATSMIDADSEAKIAEAVAEFSEGRTCLIVAHRLSTVINADRIVVMDQGAVMDQGTHAELLHRCETYKLIAQNQLLKSDPGA